MAGKDEGALASPRVADDVDPAFFDRGADIDFAAGNLPHWRQSGRTYFVTFRLDDALPEGVAAEIRRERLAWLRRHPKPWTSRQRAEYHRLFSRRVDERLDAGHGACLFRDAALRRIVEDALLHFDGERYILHDWVIMPNHVHLLITVRGNHDLSRVLHSLKSWTSNAIHAVLGRTGKLWQKESYDRIVRSPEEFERFRAYIAANPAGLPAGTFAWGSRGRGSRVSGA